MLRLPVIESNWSSEPLPATPDQSSTLPISPPCKSFWTWLESSGEDLDLTRVKKSLIELCITWQITKQLNAVKHRESMGWWDWSLSSLDDTSDASSGWLSRLVLNRSFLRDLGVGVRSSVKTGVLHSRDRASRRLGRPTECLGVRPGSAVEDRDFIRED